MKINSDHVGQIKALIESGDVNLTERRTAFARMAERSTTLNDEELIAAIAATDDDDDDLFVQNVIIVENEGFTVEA